MNVLDDESRVYKLCINIELLLFTYKSYNVGKCCKLQKCTCTLFLVNQPYKDCLVENIQWQDTTSLDTIFFPFFFKLGVIKLLVDWIIKVNFQYDR